MSDEPFQRPGAATPPTSKSWTNESPIPEETPGTAADVSTVVRHEEGRSRTPTIGQAGIARFPKVVAVATVALLVGVAVGALAVDRPSPAATPITVDSFPRELLGRTRDDVEMRDGGSTPAIERLNAHFEAQLAGYRFAYGGEGAEFRYGESYTLTIVNGRLASEIPHPNHTEWAVPTVISLDTRDTSCTSSQSIIQHDIAFETELPVDPMLNDDLRQSEEKAVWTDCVLFDKQRNLALRLRGEGPGDDILQAAGQFRDELERIHADLIA